METEVNEGESNNRNGSIISTLLISRAIIINRWAKRLRLLTDIGRLLLFCVHAPKVSRRENCIQKS